MLLLFKQFKKIKSSILFFKSQEFHKFILVVELKRSPQMAANPWNQCYSCGGAWRALPPQNFLELKL